MGMPPATAASKFKATWCCSASAARAKPGKTDFQRHDHGPSRGEQSGASAPRGEGNHVVQLFDAGFKETADVARGLADALLVLDQRDANEALAVLAEGDAGRDRKLGLLDQQRGELETPERLEHRRDRRPSEHPGPRPPERPTSPGPRIPPHPPPT